MIGADRHGPQRGRYRADFPPGTVVFLIGRRINSWRSVRSWLPIFLTMLQELFRQPYRQPELRLLGARTWVDGVS